jgi:hypothetical protein
LLAGAAVVGEAGGNHTIAVAHRERRDS